jgi:hypothetical protein
VSIDIPESPSPGKYLAGLSPITQEVQQREEQTAAQEALIGAWKSDAARRERILDEATTGGRRQAAEGLLQGTRGVEVGTGVHAGLGRQAAADVLMAEQQLAATTAAETPASDLANIEASVLSAVQALGTDMTDRVGKMTTYAEIIDSYKEDSTKQDAAIDAIMALEAGQANPDWFIIMTLNDQRSTPNPQFSVPGSLAPGVEPVWTQDENGNWTYAVPGPPGLSVTKGGYDDSVPEGSVVNGWTHGGGGLWYRTYTDESGNQQVEQKQGTPAAPPAG